MYEALRPGYSRSFTYVPTLTPIDAGTMALTSDMPRWGYTRVGPGPGPRSGDTIEVFACVDLGTVAEGPTAGGGIASVPVPIDTTKPHSADALTGYMDTAVEARVLVYTPSSALAMLARNIGVADGPQRVQFAVRYQAA